MELLLLAAIAVAASQPEPLSEAAHAIKAGRLDQARIMISTAVKAGARGEAIDRLITDLAFESGSFGAALSGYELLLKTHPDDLLLAERAGIAAIHTGDFERAMTLLEQATASDTASWQAWNARGVAADHRRDWEVADLAYAQAITLQPSGAIVANNLGWSLLMRGHWIEALQQLEHAAALDSKSQRIADNVDLARTAVSVNLPRRRRGESDSDWAARLNDAGVIASIRGEQKRAIAAFAQAIEARSQWFDRAANNLARAQGKQ